MPIADPSTYRQMLRAASVGEYALPSINVTSSSTLHGVLAGLAEAESDGIIGVGLGGARFASGSTNSDLARGATALAEFAHAVADAYPINVALHTDHCPPTQLSDFVQPLIAASRDRRTHGRGPLFQSHMFDGSHLDLDENIAASRELLAQLSPLGIVLEMEIGLVGGEEDEIDNRGVDEAKLYTSPSDMLAVVEALGAGQDAGYMVAASFGNVHGIHPPGDITLDPGVLQRGQAAIADRFDDHHRLLLVFHGGSGSSPAEIDESIAHGVVKMNVDTDTQYAYSRAVAHHMLSRYDEVIAVDRDLPNKTAFAQPAWMELGEAAMASRVVAVCESLHCAGTSLRS